MEFVITRAKENKNILEPEERTSDDVPQESIDSTNEETPDCPAPEKHAYKSGVVDEMIEWGKSVAVALVLAVVIKVFFVQAYVIPTLSMAPTVLGGDRIFGNRFVYRLHSPRHGDVIAFIPPKAVRNKKGKVIPFLKRIIAVEGDTIAIRNGVTYVNGKPLDEPYIKEPPAHDFPRARSGKKFVEIPEGYLFVMGDNRNNSLDSRRWGLLPKKNVQAQAFFRFWPPRRIGTLR